jgi:hypothetical protein
MERQVKLETIPDYPLPADPPMEPHGWESEPHDGYNGYQSNVYPPAAPAPPEIPILGPSPVSQTKPVPPIQISYQQESKPSNAIHPNHSFASIQNDYPGLIPNAHYSPVSKPTAPVEDEGLARENEDLLREIEALEGNKRQLQDNIRKAKRSSVSAYGNASQSHINPSKPSPSGLYKVMRNADIQMVQLNQRLKRLEDEYVKVSTDTHDTKDYLHLRSYHTRDGLTIDVPRRTPSRTIADRGSGRQIGGQSVFVDQMYQDINRVLNKPNRYHKNGSNVPVF